MEPGWNYNAELTSARSFHTIGVDWDKYGAGTNIVVLEVCSDSYEEERFRNKVKICYREEIPKSEYTLTKAVSRIVQLNDIFKPKHIYVDRGYGEVQVELLHKYGVENPMSGLKERVKGVSFSETIDVKDPYTKQSVKKEIKPYMVDNLRQYLEKEVLAISERDAEMYMQLISYVVLRTTQTGRPVFEAGGSAVDHAHDALILALLAITENYSDLHKAKFAARTESFSNTFFMPKSVNDKDDDDKDAKIGSIPSGRADKLMPQKFGHKKSFGSRSNSTIRRKTF
jgi:replicative DNA helicase